MSMTIDIFAVASLAFALIVSCGIVYLLWKLWRDQTPLLSLRHV
jgi:hypothetical protein